MEPTPKKGNTGELTSKREIDNAYNNGKINNRDYRTLTDSYVTNITMGKNAGVQLAVGEISKEADAKFGNDKQGKAEYLAVIKRAASGKTPEQLKQFAKDELGTHAEKGKYWGTNDIKNWKTDFQKNQAQDTAMAKVHEDVGVSQLNGIIDGYERTTRGQKMGLNEISTFADQVGGYKALKQGMPANNAIQSILAHGGVVTPAAINAVLKIKKDGNF